MVTYRCTLEAKIAYMNDFTKYRNYVMKAFFFTINITSYNFFNFKKRKRGPIKSYVKLFEILICTENDLDISSNNFFKLTTLSCHGIGEKIHEMI